MSDERPETFRGRKIYLTSRYPSVTWPSHPEAMGVGGYVYIHRVIAHEKYGEIPDGMVVHHKDENVWNWDEDNLELMTIGDHNREHNTNEIIIRKCSNCYGEVPIRTKRRKEQDCVYCSWSCVLKDDKNVGAYKIDWPSDERMQEWVWEEPTTRIAKKLGVSGRVVTKHCRRRGIDKPGRGYWSTKGYFTVKSGVESNSAKLTQEEVREIRERYEPYKVSQRKLAKEYDVSKSTIGRIVNGKTYT